MWDWSHFKQEGFLAHTKRSARLSVLLLLSGCTMALHMLVPFWQQPQWLCAENVAAKICREMNNLRE